jgi:hypothetical protein
VFTQPISPKQFTEMSKPFNFWPWAIVLLFVVFAGSMIGVMIMFMHQDMDLVAEDYYAKEVVFQNQIDKEKNAVESGRAPEVHYDQAQGLLTLHFPDLGADDREGEVQLYRPSNSDLDQTHALKTDAEGSQTISVKALQQGRWVLKVDWEERGVAYYIQQDLYFN